MGEAAVQTQRSQRMRVTPHLLLLGDPGTGNSQLLQAAQELSGRSIRTSGLGCTNAGLTCAAVRDGPDFVLEAGALVLADGGVCCIDEFSTIRSHDKAAVHEAMEQQTISVAKAGLVCRLRSECSVVAAQNCRGGSSKRCHGASYNTNASVAVNSGLPPPLLSRFDIVVVFASSGRGTATEAEKAEFILDVAQGCSNETATDIPHRSLEEDSGAAVGAILGTEGKVWDHGRLRAFVTWARQNELPDPPEEQAQEVLERYFAKLRTDAAQGSSGSGGGGITVRTLQSLWRLAQAHARLLHHSRVCLGDAVAVVVLHRAALQDHVVGAETPGPGDSSELTPSLPNLDGEVAPCSVQSSSVGVELHHDTDISSIAQYSFWEDRMLRYLGLRQGGGPQPLEDVPRAGSSPGAGDGAPSLTDGNSQASTSSTQRGGGKCLGCRPR